MFTESAAFYDALYSWKDYPAETAALIEIIRARRPDARTLLDVACGTGKHLELLQAEFDVEGLDLDEKLLAVARERLPDVPLHTGDMTDFDLGKQFDVITNMFSAIGYVGSVERLQAALHSHARHVAPGGVIIIEPWFTPDQFTNRRLGILNVEQEHYKVTRMSHAQVEARVSILEFHYLIGDYNGIIHRQERHELMLFTHEEYLEAFTNAGLQVEHLPANEVLDRGLYVGIKPG